jgi:hypothetical protein
LRHAAERIREMCALQKKLVEHISSEAQTRVAQWKNALGTVL